MTGMHAVLTVKTTGGPNHPPPGGRQAGPGPQPGDSSMGCIQKLDSFADLDSRSVDGLHECRSQGWHPPQ